MKRSYGLLIVDDHRFIRESIRQSVDWERLRVTIVGEAQNGADAYEQVLRLKPDIVITDIRMPSLEGLDLVEKLQSVRLRPEVIVITGFQEFEYAQRALRLGVCDLVLKPIKNEELIAAVQKAIDHLESEAAQAEKAMMLPTDNSMVNAAASSGESLGLLTISMLSFISLHCAENITLESVADKFQISAGYASRLITKATGRGFAQFLCDARIEVAKRLLADPRMRIKEIVYQSGFSEYSYFRKIFKKRVGCSPQQYRLNLVKLPNLESGQQGIT